MILDRKLRTSHVPANTHAKRTYPRAYIAALLRRGLPARIRQLRKERGWTQDQLATAMGATGPDQMHISRIESTRSGRFLSLGTLLRVAEALEMALVVELVPLDQFMADRENERPQDC